MTNTTAMIDHRFFPHIIDLILEELPYEAYPTARLVCREWVEDLESCKFVRHVAFSYHPPQDGYVSDFMDDPANDYADNGSLVLLRAVNLLNDRSLVLKLAPSNYWTFHDPSPKNSGEDDNGDDGVKSERGEELGAVERERAYWKLRLRNTEVADFIGFDDHPCSEGLNLCSVGVSAVYALDSLVDNIPIIRWWGDFQPDPYYTLRHHTASDFDRYEYMWAARGPRQVIYHYLIRFHHQLDLREVPSEPNIRAPVIMNLVLDDHEDHDCQHARQVDRAPEDMFLEQLPDFQTIIDGIKSPPPGQPHLTIILQDQLHFTNLERFDRVVHLLSHFLLSDLWREDQMVWLVGLERFLFDPEEQPTPTEWRREWTRLLDKCDALVQAEGIACEDWIRVLTMDQYRASVGDDFLFKLRTEQPDVELEGKSAEDMLCSSSSASPQSRALHQPPFRSDHDLYR